MCSTRQRLAALLREVRESRSLTLRQAAVRASLAPSTLSRWESGTCVPRVPELEGLLRALGVEKGDALRILASLDAPRAAKAVRNAGTVAPSGGALLRALRHRAGLSLVEVATKLGVAASTVSRWESSALHPAPPAAEALLNLLRATPEERTCVLASGVAKLKADRPAFEPARYARELAAIEATLGEMPQDAAELRLLQLESLLWWSLREPEAPVLLRRVQIAYARFLERRCRYAEAIVQAEQSLQGVSDYGESLAIAACRVIARADVFRWPVERPHLGLFTLQQCLVKARDEAARSGILADMAEFSRLAGRFEEAASYAERATEAAQGLVRRARQDERTWHPLGRVPEARAALVNAV